MKRFFIKPTLITAFLIYGCNTNQNELDERKDSGIKSDRDSETTVGDTTKTDEINATENAQSGPDEGP